MTVAIANNAPAVAKRMATTCGERERRDPLYFTVEGKLIPIAGWKYGHGPDNGKNGRGRNEAPGNAVYVVDYPFRPSPRSCEAMVTEYLRTGQPITYDEARWEDDPIVDEQAGPSVVEDWALDELLGKVAA